jgi:hypothetical protein
MHAADFLLGEFGDQADVMFWFVYRWHYTRGIMNMLTWILQERGAENVQFNRVTGTVAIWPRKLKFIRTDDENARLGYDQHYSIYDSAFEPRD